MSDDEHTHGECCGEPPFGETGDSTRAAWINWRDTHSRVHGKACGCPPQGRKRG